MADRCKFEKYQYQVSYDSGSTWENVTPVQVRKGNITEYMSADCSEIETLYRWVDMEGTYICDGNNKYTRQMQEESYDNGISWYASYPTVYRQGTFVGTDSEYCADKFVGHYIYVEPTPTHRCPQWYKWNGEKCVYVDPLKVVKCNDSTTLTSAETEYYTSGYILVSAEIGNCVTYIGLTAFRNCVSLRSIEIPNSVTSIDEGAFRNCTSLASINIPSGVTSIGESTFNTCISLSNCTIGNGVTSIGKYAFSGCTSLTNITIGSGVTNIKDYAFYGCTSLTNINIPNSVSWIGDYAFYNCTGLTTVTIGSGINTIYGKAFSGCTSLTSITINATTPPTLIEFNEFNNTNNCPIYVPCDSVNTYLLANGWNTYGSRIYGIPPCETPIKFKAYYDGGTSYSQRCNGDSTLHSGDTNPSVYQHSAMTSAQIGECVTSIGSYVFSDCSSLTSITINATAPPKINYHAFDDTNNCPIYVPCGSLVIYNIASNYPTERLHEVEPCEEPLEFTHFVSTSAVSYTDGYYVSAKYEFMTTARNGSITIDFYDQNSIYLEWAAYADSTCTLSVIKDGSTIGSLSVRYSSGQPSMKTATGTFSIGSGYHRVELVYSKGSGGGQIGISGF